MNSVLSQQRFLFETSFDDANGEIVRDASQEKAEEPKYGAAELAQARDEGFAAGRQAALEDALLEAEQRTAAIEDRIAAALTDLVESRQAMDLLLARESAEATLAMLRKLFPRLAEKAGFTEVEALIDDCLDRVRQEPRIVIRVSGDQVEMLAERAEALAKGRAYEGKVVVLPDEAIAPGDALVEWADGGAARDCGRLMEEMDAAMARTQFLLDAGFGDAGGNMTKESPHG